jgi:hypothetical protein
MGRLRAEPIELKEAQEFINRLHRHHAASHRDKFRVAAVLDGEIVGVAQVGRPLSRKLCDGYTLEVLRLCTTGEKDVCSFLYSKCARIARELGYRKIITYILESESGASLRASGWVCECDKCGGGTWENSTRAKQRHVGEQLSFLEKKPKYPENVSKKRYSKTL